MDCKRDEFELPEGVIYLDGAGRSPLLKAVREAGEAAVGLKSWPWTMKEEPGMQTAVRSMFASLIGAPGPETIAITPSTSYAVSSAAKNVALAAGERVLVLADQMGSNVLPWQDLCKRSGGFLHVVERPSDGDWTHAVLAALKRSSNRVRVVALPNCHWADGSLLDLNAVGAHCHELRIPLVVDLTQSAGMLEFDVERVKPSFVACSVHKWLLGAYGFSLLYVAPGFHASGRPLEHFERNRRGADLAEWEEEKVMTAAGYPEEFEGGARRFDGGGRTNPITLPMLHTALRHLSAWGVGPISARVGGLTSRIAAAARALGVRTPPVHAPHIIGLSWAPQVSCATRQQFKAWMKERKVYVSVRAGIVRVSVGVYTTDEDIDQFTALMKEFFHAHPGCEAEGAIRPSPADARSRL